jgi:peptidyl-prolyl cis-trans isomerase SurA
MKSKPIFIIILVVLPLLGYAQDLNKRVLLTVAGKEIQAGEFIRMYKKSLEPEKPLSPSEYLQQFIIFKLKVADALSQGTDTTKAFKSEFNGYRNQLAQNYLTDPDIKERMLLDAYNRSLIEIKAWHLLLMAKADASPADTLKAFQKATAARERIIAGEPFEEVAKSVSEDPSAKMNGGNLGYFTVFQMIAPFEDAAYKLNTGDISQPVRSPFGYHIIKIADKHPARGKVKVAHIMKAAPPGAGDQDISKAEDGIKDIYRQLQAGASFRDLAARLSDHKESAAKGGEMNWFGTGEILSEFSEAAFALSDTGAYSKPFRSVYGWHIIKLLDRKAPGTYEETRPYLESKLNQSKLNSATKASFIEKLKTEYKFSVNQKVLKWFLTKTDTLIANGTVSYNRVKIPKGNIYSFADQMFSSAKFADYIESNRAAIPFRNPDDFINTALEMKIAVHLMDYENSVLEKKYPEFRYLMGEFHDGMLLFDISGKKVWTRVSSDSTGLQTYFNAHRNNYLSPDGLPKELKDIQGEVMTGYQEMLENDWIIQLKEKYTVTVDNTVLREIEKNLKNE